MRCLHCGTTISFVRRWKDRQFCCDEHRVKAAHGVYSARATRDEYDESFEESWLVRETTTKVAPGSFGPGKGVVLVVLTALLVVFLPGGPDGAAPAPQSYTPSASNFGSRLQNALPGRGSLSIREDFRSDFRNWQSPFDSMGDWRRVGRSVQLGGLRLWKPTLSLHDYTLEFETEIQQKGVGWAFRAADPKNFYATKINVTRAPGAKTAERAEIIRWAVVNGKQMARTALPIPLSAVDDHGTYEVKVGVRGSRFTTVLNGQAVDNWADNRLKRGGVGFFNDPGEKATLHWVSISEKENFLQRFLSFSFYVHASWPQPEE